MEIALLPEIEAQKVIIIPEEKEIGKKARSGRNLAAGKMPDRNSRDSCAVDAIQEKDKFLSSTPVEIKLERNDDTDRE